MNTRDWNWYYSNPAKAADTIASLHTLLWDILDAPKGRLNAGLVKRIDTALSGRRRPEVTVTTAHE